MAVKDNSESEVDHFLKRKFQGLVADIVMVEKEDLDLVSSFSAMLPRPFS